MTRLLTITIPVLFAVNVSYADVGPKQLGMIPAVPSQATNGYALNYTLDAASGTFEVENLKLSGTYGLMILFLALTDANDSCTAVTMSCTGSPDNNTTDYTLQSCTTVTGVCTSADASWVKDASGNTTVDTKRWVWRVDIEGMEDVECTFTDTSGAAADSLRVEAYLATKGS